MVTIVSFSIAKLLKEKGFDEICYKYVELNLLDNTFGRVCKDRKTRNSILEKRRKEYSSQYKGLLPEFVTIPTIAETVTWLYETYGVWIFVSKTSKSDKWYYSYQSENDREASMKDYDSLTEAYESAIEYCLTNLI